MAKSTNNNILMPSVSFHQRTYGKHIQLDSNGSIALRHTSFDHGVTFTNRPIKINERIHMKIVDIDETGQWLGSLAIGFTQIDPSSIRKEDLCKSALPNLCQKDGISYMKRISDKLTREIIITFYYNQEGAFYILDGREQELCKNVHVSKSLWAVIDVYGNVKGVSFTSAPKITNGGSGEFFKKYHQKPDQLPITYFTNLNTEKPQPTAFHQAHGVELELFCQNTVAFRKNVQKLARPYVFINYPMKTGDELYIRILSIDPNYRTPGVIGFTNTNPSIFATQFHELPSGDPMGLYDRREYWIIIEDAFDEKSNELDEYCFKFASDGAIHMDRNKDSRSIKTIAFADTSQALYPFFFLNGRISAFSLIGLKSPLLLLPSPSLSTKNKDENTGLCQICLDAKADCVFIPCGHVFFCSDCKDSCSRKLAESRCPICRKVYTDIFQIADD